MNLFHRLFAWNDRRRARAYLHHVCSVRAEVLRLLDETNRKADRALRDAQKLEAEKFRAEFFDGRDLVRSAFIGREGV